MDTFFVIFITLLALAVIGWLADRRAAAQKPKVTPGLSFLPGDIKYESREQMRQKFVRYSMASSAVICKIMGIVTPSAFAVLRLMIRRGRIRPSP
jgi:hypothetical protein